MKNKLPIFACEIDEKDDTGILAMSFVESPAVEVDFVALSKTKKAHKLHLNEDKQILTGVVLQPGQLIYREDDANGEYYITFSEVVIEKIARKMMRTGVALQNTTHQHERGLTGNYLTEIWIVENPDLDKSKALGFDGLPKGTLMCSYRVADTGYWRKEVKTGNVKGFSLEGFFYQTEINMSKKTKTNLGKKQTPKKQGKLAAFLQSIGMFLEDESAETVEEAEAVADVAQEDETASGTPLLAFELADGNIIEVDGDGFATMNGEQAPAGSHELADGNFITINDDGSFVQTQPEGEGAEPTEPNAELSAALKRGRAYLAKQNPNASEIAKLKAKIAELEKKPTAKPAKPTDANPTIKPVTHTDKMAAIAKLSLKKK